jgi:hypothetical protein
VRCGSCGSGSLGRPASEPGRFMSRGRGPRGGCPPPEGVDVAYPRERVPRLGEIHNGRGIFFPINVHGAKLRREGVRREPTRNP